MKEMLMRNSKSLRFFRDLPDGARQETAFSQLPWSSFSEHPGWKSRKKRAFPLQK